MDEFQVLTNCAERVVLGVEFLNEHVPGWTAEDKLHLGELDLADMDHCVLGQLVANSALRSAGFDMDETNPYSQRYTRAIDALRIRGAEYGFDIDTGTNSQDEYGVLNHLWTHAIRRTRKGKSVTVGKLIGNYIDQMFIG